MQPITLCLKGAEPSGPQLCAMLPALAAADSTLSAVVGLLPTS